MTDRILSRHGNVIAADFRPEKPTGITASLDFETLYQDDLLMVIRATPMCDGRPFGQPMHFAADLLTGRLLT